ncbi:hypothetical protein HYPSUDRAFT_433154 [Hypholoma sublateritium FD-334 SS-4]|uniref:Uncharacterized protein n=1 Tax=Hypholoma sublateritium (strain FD-334 SS-4) TaxID=945553 RepID=A0A0D2Q0C2_HYPSF|nr:hypothetical protein HYPSUDRAFT_433154 [Hypholoma sublateritium FD-334 SS-4]
MSMSYSCLEELFFIPASADDTDLQAALLLDSKKRSSSKYEHSSMLSSNNAQPRNAQYADARCPWHIAVSRSGKPSQSAVSSGCRTAYDTVYPLRQRLKNRKGSLVDDYINPLKEPTTILKASGLHCSRDCRVASDHRVSSEALAHQPASLVVDAVTALGELLKVELNCNAPLGVSLPSRLAELWRLAQSSIGTMPAEFRASMPAKFQNECRVLVDGEYDGPTVDGQHEWEAQMYALERQYLFLI